MTELSDLVYICNSFYKERCDVNNYVLFIFVLFYWCIGLFYLQNISCIHGGQKTEELIPPGINIILSSVLKSAFLFLPI